MNLKFLRWKPSRLNAFRWLCDYRKATELRKSERTHKKSIFLSFPPTQFIFYFTVFKCLVTHLNWEFHSLKTEWKKPSFLLTARFLRTLTQISKERQKNQGFLHGKESREARVWWQLSSYLSWWQNVVHIFQKWLVFNIIVREDESDSFALLASCSV